MPAPRVNTTQHSQARSHSRARTALAGREGCGAQAAPDGSKHVCARVVCRVLRRRQGHQRVCQPLQALHGAAGRHAQPHHHCAHARRQLAQLLRMAEVVWQKRRGTRAHLLISCRDCIARSSHAAMLSQGLQHRLLTVTVLEQGARDGRLLRRCRRQLGAKAPNARRRRCSPSSAGAAQGRASDRGCIAPPSASAAASSGSAPARLAKLMQYPCHGAPCQPAYHLLNSPMGCAQSNASLVICSQPPHTESPTPLARTRSARMLQPDRPCGVP